MGAQPERVFPMFFGVWVALGLVFTAFFYLNKDAALKRKVHPPFAIAVGVLFLGFVMLTGKPRDAFFLFVMVPAIALITLLNIRNTKFCSACGKMLVSQNPFAPPKFCTKCGASLDEQT